MAVQLPPAETEPATIRIQLVPPHDHNPSADGLSTCSIRTGGYCRARQRLPLEMVGALTRQTGRLLSQKARAPWLWRGRAVKLVDGTGLSMPDTSENQAVYPSPARRHPA